MTQLLKKKARHMGKKEALEDLLPEEEAAIEEGRKAYMRGAWVSLNKIRDGMASSRNKTRAKKS